MQPKLVAFDLDNTLAPSRGPISDEMASRIGALLNYVDVCVITGGSQAQIMKQVVDRLPVVANTDRLHLMPTCGTKYFQIIKNQPVVRYEQNLNPRDADAAMYELELASKFYGYWHEEPWGDIIENRGSQVTFSALGQKAPLEAKEAWDPDNAKKKKIKKAVSSRLPHLEVRIGGTTSIDVTMKGIDKGYGIMKLCDLTGLHPTDILFIGDRLDKDGNDYPVKSTGAVCVPVKNPDGTIRILDELLTVWYSNKTKTQ
jgi:HAD superfamily hydrolase (TIGR01484 family)